MHQKKFIRESSFKLFLSKIPTLCRIFVRHLSERKNCRTGCGFNTTFEVALNLNVTLNPTTFLKVSGNVAFIPNTKSEILITVSPIVFYGILVIRFFNNIINSFLKPKEEGLFTKIFQEPVSEVNFFCRLNLNLRL